jgi:hypothetical protein
MKRVGRASAAFVRREAHPNPPYSGYLSSAEKYPMGSSSNSSEIRG